MRAFNLTTPTITPSYENAIQAGSLSHTGNSFRPVASPVKTISPGFAQVVQPGSFPRVVAHPVAPISGVFGARTFSTPHGITSRPVAHVPSIRGIIGQ